MSQKYIYALQTENSISNHNYVLEGRRFARQTDRQTPNRENYNSNLSKASHFKSQIINNKHTQNISVPIIGYWNYLGICVY